MIYLVFNRLTIYSHDYELSLISFAASGVYYTRITIIPRNIYNIYISCFIVFGKTVARHIRGIILFISLNVSGFLDFHSFDV